MNDQPPGKLNGIAQALRTNVHRSALPIPTTNAPGERTPLLNWQYSPEELHHALRCADRLRDLAECAGAIPEKFDRLTCAMDLLAVHLNCMPLQLFQLLLSSDDDFSHDVLGIGMHIDRTTGQLRNGFRPRCRKDK